MQHDEATAPRFIFTTGAIPMTINLDTLEKLGPLKSGSHLSPDAGACIMEAVAFVAGEPWSDHPQCVSPLIGAFLRNWNDNLETDADRDRLLKPLIPKIINTRADASTEEQRSFLALGWMVPTFLPAWLHLAKLHHHADTVAGLTPIMGMATATAGEPVARAANDAAAKRWSTAQSATGNAVVAAAWDGAWAAAGAATRAAAGGEAWEAVMATPWDSSGEAAWEAVPVAAWEAAAHVAWEAGN